MNKSWHGIMKIINIQQIRNNSIIWEDKNINNTLHVLGEEFFLQCCFATQTGYPPNNYYLGLDNRATVSTSDTISSLTGEPTGTNGYSRKPVSSSTGFAIELVSGVYRATSSVVSFTAAGGSWGPVSKIFMSTDLTGGVLLATASLSNAITLNDGDAVNMKMALSLQDY